MTDFNTSCWFTYRHASGSCPHVRAVLVAQGQSSVQSAKQWLLTRLAPNAEDNDGLLLSRRPFYVGLGARSVALYPTFQQFAVVETRVGYLGMIDVRDVPEGCRVVVQEICGSLGARARSVVMHALALVGAATFCRKEAETSLVRFVDADAGLEGNQFAAGFPLRRPGRLRLVFLCRIDCTRGRIPGLLTCCIPEFSLCLECR